MTKDEYCYTICKGKCCKHCPNLGADFKCKIFSSWKDGWCHFKNNDMIAAPIEEILSRNLLDAGVREQCVYAHPEILWRF